MLYQNVKVKPRQTVAQTQQSKDLGIVSEVPMDDWNATTQYQKLNKVRYVSTGGSGVTLLAKKQNQGVEPFVSQGWQEVWMVENYDGGAVSPDGTYPEMMVGNATNAQNDGNGENIAEQFSNINDKIPSSASADNQLADKAFVNSSINNLAAFYITPTAAGDEAWATRAALLSATTFYNAGEVRVPTTNDYAIVLADESQPVGVDGTHPTTRYSYQGGTYPNGQWDFQYVVNNTSLTQAQVNAINSGITAELVEQIGKGNVLSVNGETGAVTITPAKIGAVDKAGDTMTGALVVENAGGAAQVQIQNSQGDTYFAASRTDKNNTLRFGIGVGGTNRGIFDVALNKWVFNVDGSGNVKVNGYVPYSSNNPPPSYRHAVTIEAYTATATVKLSLPPIYASTNTPINTQQNLRNYFDSIGAHTQDTATPCTGFVTGANLVIRAVYITTAGRMFLVYNNSIVDCSSFVCADTVSTA